MDRKRYCQREGGTGGYHSNTPPGIQHPFSFESSIPLHASCFQLPLAAVFTVFVPLGREFRGWLVCLFSSGAGYLDPHAYVTARS